MSMIPGNDGAGTKMLTIKVSQNNFDNVALTGTPDLYTSLFFPQATNFTVATGTLIPVTVTGPCIVSGTAYTLNEFVFGR
ncbi:MAG: hypothetical protein M3N13_03040, partial [Candidatus Eremiobacteraeota bacterium]|nr:hypothetical protein [Candidatus Eremiobacteraeota bacterium]